MQPHSRQHIHHRIHNCQFQSCNADWRHMSLSCIGYLSGHADPLQTIDVEQAPPKNAHFEQIYEKREINCELQQQKRHHHHVTFIPTNFLGEHFHLKNKTRNHIASD